MEITYKTIYDDTGMVFIISGIVQFILGPLFGLWFDRVKRAHRRRIVILILIITYLTIFLFPIPFIKTDKMYHSDDGQRTGQIIFIVIGILFGIQNCGMNTIGGPIRSWTFPKERLLVLSFATYRFIYYLSVAVAFF